MKIKYAIIAATIIAAATVTSVKAFKESTPLFDANVEALAEQESTGGEKCFNSITTAEGRMVLYCGDCIWHPGKPTFYSGSGKC